MVIKAQRRMISENIKLDNTICIECVSYAPAIACKPPENIPADIALTNATPTKDVDEATIGIAEFFSIVEDEISMPFCRCFDKEFCSSCRDATSERKDRYDLV
jgi:hypothetical protein